MTVPLAPSARTDRPATTRGTSLPGPLRAIATAFHRLLYLVSAIPLGAVWLLLLIVGWVLLLLSAITPLLPAALIAFDRSVRFAVWIEGYLARRLLGAPVAPRRLPPERRSYWGSVGGVLGDRGFWTGQAFLVLRTVLGLVTAVLVLTVLAAALEAMAAPLLHRVIPTEDGHGVDLGIWLVDTWPESLLLVPAGLVVLAWGIGLLHGCAAIWRGLATSILGRQA